jgi:Spy/CpxP family protein refolding chaperone
MGRGMGPGPGGKWWDNPEIAKRVGITSDQKKKIDDVFVQSRMRLIDLHASLEKDELTLDTLIQGPALDDSKILPAVDRIALDRAELEKADARLLLGIRHILTPEQWTTLDQHDERGPRGGRQGGQQFGRGPGRPGGPGDQGPNPPPPPREE